MTSPLDAWLDRARHRIEFTALVATAEEIGTVRSTGDGIAQVSGLPSVTDRALVA